MSYIDESLTAKGYTPAALVTAAFGQARTIDGIVIHHWGDRGQTHDGVVNFFVNGPGATSAHFVVSAGRITSLVNPADAAWHCPGKNATTIGIECRPEATDADYATVAELVRYLRAQYGYLPLSMHRDWYATACPGVWDLARIDTLASGAASQGGTIAPAGELANTSTPKEWDELATKDEVKQAAKEAIDGWSISDGFQKRMDGRSPVDFLLQLRAEQGGLIATVRALTAAVGALASSGGSVTPEQVDKSIKDAVAAWAAEYEPAIVKKDAQ
jgi:hypothetical protein